MANFWERERVLSDEETRKVQADMYGDNHANREHTRRRAADATNSQGTKGWYTDEEGNRCFGR